MVQTITKQDFLDKVFNFEASQEWDFTGDVPAIIDFYADWCGPCKALAPLLEDLQKEYNGKINIYKVDTEAEQELAGAFGIRSIPSLLFCPKGEKPQMAQGALPKQQFEELIKTILKVEK
ncbi:MAG: thioredoxin [Wenyingzhuangia sp.]|jgi:thioredoxin 1|uniref:thioredoxin n=1 Tax=Wenyingzhuangia sp. TaxID=1964193 RepID=UPI0032199EC1